MPASGASPTPRPDLNLLDERRSAHASIRGYLYQTCLGVQRWLDLQPGELLLCEGDEDLDRFLLHGGAVSEQVKAHTGGLSITDRVVRDSLRNFLRSYVTLRQRGEDRKFVFTTTAYEKKKRTDGLDFDLLKKWKEGDRTPEVIEKVRSLVQPADNDKNWKEIEEARAWLDGTADGWAVFMNAVEWSFSAPELDALRDQIERKLMADRAAAAPAQLLDRLVVHALRTSSQKEVKERILTREILDVQISAFLSDLARWAGSPEGVRIRTVFDEIDRLRDLLDEGTRDLPANPTPRPDPDRGLRGDSLRRGRPPGRAGIPGLLVRERRSPERPPPHRRRRLRQDTADARMVPTTPSPGLARGLPDAEPRKGSDPPPPQRHRAPAGGDRLCRDPAGNRGTPAR